MNTTKYTICTYRNYNEHSLTQATVWRHMHGVAMWRYYHATVWRCDGVMLWRYYDATAWRYSLPLYHYLLPKWSPHVNRNALNNPFCCNTYSLSQPRSLAPKIQQYNYIISKKLHTLIRAVSLMINSNRSCVYNAMPKLSPQLGHFDVNENLIYRL